MKSRGWVIRREFDTDEGTVARWWLGPDWGDDEGAAFGEPEDCRAFPTRIIAEAEYRVCCGSLRGVRAQRVEEAYAEVGAGALP